MVNDLDPFATSKCFLYYKKQLLLQFQKDYFDINMRKFFRSLCFYLVVLLNDITGKCSASAFRKTRKLMLCINCYCTPKFRCIILIKKNQKLFQSRSSEIILPGKKSLVLIICIHSTTVIFGHFFKQDYYHSNEIKKTQEPNPLHQ